LHRFFSSQPGQYVKDTISGIKSTVQDTAAETAQKVGEALSEAAPEPLKAASHTVQETIAPVEAAAAEGAEKVKTVMAALRDLAKTIINGQKETGNNDLSPTLRQLLLDRGFIESARGEWVKPDARAMIFRLPKDPVTEFSKVYAQGVLFVAPTEVREDGKFKARLEAIVPDMNLSYCKDVDSAWNPVAIPGLSFKMGPVSAGCSVGGELAKKARAYELRLDFFLHVEVAGKKRELPVASIGPYPLTAGTTY